MKGFIPISVTKNVTDTGSMQKEATSATEQVERKKNDTEKDDTERKRKPDTSHLEGLLFYTESLWSWDKLIWPQSKNISK